MYADICDGIDRRSTVQQHIHEHIDDFVAVTVVVIDGEPHSNWRWGRPHSLVSSWAPRFYVEPRTGLLRVNPWRERLRRERNKPPARGVELRRELSPFVQLHRVEGIWYEVDLAPIPADVDGHGVFDVLLHQRVTTRERRPKGKQPEGKRIVHCDPESYGKDDVYAWRKRQLAASELRRHGLANAAH